MLAWTPVNDIEKALSTALGAADEPRAQLIIRMARLALPSRSPDDRTWPTAQDPGGRRWVTAFTSPELWRAVAGDENASVRELSLPQLAANWVDNTVGLSINPATDLALALEPPALARLVSPELHQLMLLYPEGAVPILQKPLRGEELDDLLTARRTSVSGYVHLLDEVAALSSPADVLACLGTDPADLAHLVYDDGSLHLLRWPGLSLDLYRTPLGGRDEQQRDALHGWVLEPMPFVGMGMTRFDRGAVHEYHCNAVELPHAAEIVQLGVDGTFRRRAVYDGTVKRWRRVLRVEDLPADEPAAGEDR